MKRTALSAALVMFTLTACGKKPPEKPFVPDPVISPSATLPPGHPPVNTGDQAMGSSVTPTAEQTQKAIVVSTLDIPQFTYLEVKQDNKTRWLASKTIAAKKGDVILFDNGSTMSNFNSKTLQRTFPSITFVNNATLENAK
jgi:hypothetical protein